MKSLAKRSRKTKQIFANIPDTIILILVCLDIFFWAGLHQTGLGRPSHHPHFHQRRSRGSSSSMALIGPLSVFLSSLTAIPLAYTLNQLSTLRDPLVILIAGTMALTYVIAIPYFVVRNRPQRADNFFYGESGNYVFGSLPSNVFCLSPSSHWILLYSIPCIRIQNTERGIYTECGFLSLHCVLGMVSVCMYM